MKLDYAIKPRGDDALSIYLFQRGDRQTVTLILLFTEGEQLEISMQ